MDINIEPVRTAIAGCGGISIDMLDVIRDYPELDIVALQDINPETVDRMAGRFSIPNHYTEFEKLLTPDIELIVINTPNHMHRPQTLEALRAGKHCLVQKPIARNSTEAHEMIDAAKSAGKLLGVVMEELGNVVYRQMKEMLLAGCIGDVVNIQSIVAHTRHLRHPLPKGDWRTSPELIGGGSFIQLAIHHLNLAQWMLDDEIIEVGAKSMSVHSKEIFPNDETTVAWTKFAGNVLGIFTSSFAFDADVFFIHGTDGYVGHRANRFVWEVNEPFAGEAWSCNRACEQGFIELDWYLHRPTRLKPEYEQHRRFALAIRGQAEFEVPAEIGLRDLLIVEAVRKATIEGTSITI